MSETVTLYRVNPWGKTLLTAMSHEPVGEFRRVAWCRTHDSHVINDGVFCEGEYIALETGREIYGDNPCRLVEVWQEVTP